MRYLYGLLFYLLSVPHAFSAEPDLQQTTVTINTNLGKIQLALFNQQTPKTVENFLQYISDDFYRNTLFHRVTPSLIQGGLYDKKYRKKIPNYPPIVNEAQYSSHNTVGTIAMMRGRDPHSATTQFFINTANNQQRLDYASSTLQGWGYVVFGRVIKGMDIVEKIQHSKTGASGELKKYVPKPMIIIKSIDINHRAEMPVSPKKEVIKPTQKVIKHVEKTQQVQIKESLTPAHAQWSPEPPDVPAVE